MTRKDSKIEKRNEMLKSFNSEAINIETLKGLGVTFDGRKQTVRIVENGSVIERKIQQVKIENQPINYIVK